MLPPSGTSGEKHGLQVSPHRLLISYEGKHSDYMVEKTKHHLDQVIKVNVSQEGQIDIECPQM